MTYQNRLHYLSQILAQNTGIPYTVQNADEIFSMSSDEAAKTWYKIFEIVRGTWKAEVMLRAMRMFEI